MNLPCVTRYVLHVSYISSEISRIERWTGRFFSCTNIIRPKAKPEGADDEPDEQQRVAVNPQETLLRQVGQEQVGLASGAVARLRAAAGASALGLLRHDAHGEGRQQGEDCQGAQHPPGERRQ